MPTFIEFTGKKEYKCPRCKAVIRYAKFFGNDKKVLTTDGKEPYFDRDKKPMSNSGWPTDPITKQMHECKPKYDRELELKKLDTLLKDREKDDTSDSGWGDNRGNTQLESVVHNSPSLNDMDKKVRDRIIDDAYLSAKFLVWKLEGVEKACKELGIELGPQSGMIFNQVCAEDRSLKEHGE